MRELLVSFWIQYGLFITTLFGIGISYKLLLKFPKPSLTQIGMRAATVGLVLFLVYVGAWMLYQQVYTAYGFCDSIINPCQQAVIAYGIYFIQSYVTYLIICIISVTILVMRNTSKAKKSSKKK